MSSATPFQTTTVRLPKNVYEEARAAVRDAGAAPSINDFVVCAVEEKLRQMREQEIDAAFSQMRDDESYQQESVALARSFEKSDWETYQFAPSAPAIHDRSNRKKSSTKTAKR